MYTSYQGALSFIASKQSAGDYSTNTVGSFLFNVQVIVLDSPQYINAAISDGGFQNFYGWQEQTFYTFIYQVAAGSTATVGLWENIFRGGNLVTSQGQLNVVDSVSNIVDISIRKPGFLQGFHITFTDAQINVSQANALAALGAYKQSGTLTISDTPQALVSFLGSSAAASWGSSTQIVFSSNQATVTDALAIFSNWSSLAPNQQIAILDTGSSIGSNIDALNSSVNKIGSISAIGSVPISISQLSSDANIIAKLSPGTTFTITNVLISNISQALALPNVNTVGIVDTGSAISLALDQLQTAHSSQIVSISASDNSAIRLSISQFINDYGVLQKLTNASSINLTGALSDLSQIVLNNLQSLQANGQISNYSLNITASSADLSLATIQNQLETLAVAGHLSSLAVADSANVIQMSEAVYQANAAFISKLSNNAIEVTSVSAWQAAGVIADPKVASLTLSGDGPVLSSVATNSKLIGSVSILDTANHISQAFDSIAALNASQTITVSDGGALNLSISQILGNSAIFSKFSTVPHFNISDVAANLASHFDVLLQMSNIDTITLSGPASAISLSATQYANDSGFLSKISGSYSLSIGNILVENSQNYLSNAHVTSLSFVDTALNLSAGIGTLTLLSPSTISSISISDPQNSLRIGYQFWSNYLPIINKITSAYTLAVSDVPIANLSSMIATSHVGSIAITDSESNLIPYLDSIQSNLSKIQGIQLTDNLNTIDQNQGFNISVHQAIVDVDAIHYLQARQVRFAIYDSLENILANSQNITSLFALAHINSNNGIILSDTGFKSIAANDFSAINNYVTHYSCQLNITQASISNALNWQYIAAVNSISIVDTSDHIANNFRNLLHSKFASVVVSDPNNSIAISCADFATFYIASNAAYQSLIQGPYSFSVSISDASEALANLANLQANISHISSIQTYGIYGPPIIISSDQAIANQDALNLILAGNGVVDVNIAITGNQITDNATLSALGVFASKIHSFATPAGSSLHINYGQYLDYANIFNKLNPINPQVVPGQIIIDNTVTIEQAEYIRNHSPTFHVPNISGTETGAYISSNLSDLNTLFSFGGSLSISLSDPSNALKISLSQYYSASMLFSHIQNLQSIFINDSGANLNYQNIDGLTWFSNGITGSFIPPNLKIGLSSLTSNINFYAANLKVLDLSNLVGETHAAHMFTSQYGATMPGGVIVDVSVGGATYSVQIYEAQINQLNIIDYVAPAPSTPTVAATYAIPVSSIQSIGLSPDGHYLIIKIAGVTSVVGRGESLGFADHTLTTEELTSQVAPIPVFKSSGGTGGFALPDLYTGPASLGLKYQLIESADNAIVTGSSDNDFIKVSSANSIGKAVNGGGGSDVIDGGVGSTFVTGGDGHSDTFFLDGRAPGTSWSTITDFKAGVDKATIWGFVKGVSSIDTSFANFNNEGAAGYQGLTLHFKNLLPDGQTAGSNPNLNSITFSGHTLAELGASSLADLNAQINAGTNAHILIGSTQDASGTHSYLYIH
jgi:hypothetical protein